jgi:predicted RNA binding protein YcfA (HicA-like mRNA interferase family)
MKKRKLLKILKSHGFLPLGNTGHGAHERWFKDGLCVNIPRHTDVNKMLLKSILKTAGIQL